MFADADLKVIVDRNEPLDPSDAPTLRHFLRGPFTLSVQHRFRPSSPSQITFDLNFVRPDEYIQKERGIVVNGAPGVTTMSLAVFSFNEIFKAEVARATEEAMKKLRGQKVVDISLVREDNDAEVVALVLPVFYKNLNGTPDPQAEKAVPKHGEELISDSLAMGLSASKGFYKNLWQSMISFYQPTVQFVALQQAQGLEPSL